MNTLRSIDRGLVKLALGLLIVWRPPCRTYAASPSGEEALQFFNQESDARSRLGWSRNATASREEQSSRKTPMSVEVITAEDIRASGAVNLWDVLRVRAGLDVYDAQNDGLAVVSIRGFARSSIRQLQVLLDGRSVYSPSRAAVNWEQLPVQLQDIDRIEIIRGPNAVLYGSNSAVGVINIITKKPAEKLALSAGGLAGSGGTARSEAAAEQSLGDFRYRASQTHSSRDGTTLYSGATAGDFIFSNKENFRGRWDLKRGTSLDVFAGGSWDTIGKDLATSKQSSGGQNRYRQHFELARLTSEQGPGELELSAARSEVDTEQELDVGLRNLREFQYDAEAVYRLGWLDDRLNTVAGTSWRLAVAESDQEFAGDPKQQNRVARGFLNQSVEASKRLTLTGGFSLEHSDTSGYEPAWQLAAILKAAKDHFFRLSYSFAPTLPSLYDQRANSTDSSTSKTLGNPGLDSDHLRSYEAGYQGLFLDRLMADANLFYLVHRDLNQRVLLSKVGKVKTFSSANSDAATARGAELALKLKAGPGREIYANYTYEHITDEAGNLEITQETPGHKFNLGGRAELWRGLAAGANLGYKDAYSAVSSSNGSSSDIPAYWRLDARLSYSPWPGLELFIAGQNLAQAFHSSEFQNSEAVPRTYQGGVTVKF